MIIYNPNDTVLLNVEVDDTSHAYAEIMNRDDVTLEFSRAEHIDIPVGSYIDYGGKTYWLLTPAAVTVVNRRNYHYTAVFETDFGKLRMWYLHNPVDGRVKFSLTARPSEHLAMVVANLNEREGGDVWAIAPGSFDGKEVSLGYNRTRISDALTQLANECETEFEVFRSGGKVYIALGKVEYNADSPIELSYGEEGGFESGVKRVNEGGGLPIQVLYVNGGERNIDPSTYFERSHYLLLPRNYSFAFDGEHFSGEAGYNASKAVQMVTDANGYSVKLASATRGAAEESLDLSDIYPKRVGTVTAIKTIESGGDYPFYNIFDSSLGMVSGKENINFEIIEGETFTIVFQSGMLVGREIGVHKYTLDASRGVFELAQETIDGFIMPGEGGYIPQVGDTYAVFGCALPAAYIANPSTHSGAEFEMLRKAAKHLYENRLAKQSFTGTLSPVYARKNWTTIGPKIVLGGYVNFTDAAVQSQAVSMRIKAIKTFVNKPFKPEIELNNEISKGTVGGTIQSLRNEEAHIDRRFYEERGFTNRRFRDAKESQGLLEQAIEALGDEFTEGINPVTIQTMSTLVGSTNLQYEIYTTDAYTTIQGAPYFNQGDLVCPGGYVRHYTLGFDENAFVKTNRSNDEYYRWSLPNATLAPTDDGPYYLYIAATRMASAGLGTATFLLSRTAIPFMPTAKGANYDTSHIYLLYATISSAIEGSRSIATFNGFTEITPGMIRAMKWISNDGQQFIDFINKSFRIGDASKFLGYNIGANGEYDGQGRLRLKGTLVQSPSGDVFPAPCFRGEYSSANTYYYGDEVTYGGESWLHTGEAPTTGTPPADGADWTKRAARGTSGNYQVAIYRWTQSATNAPNVPTARDYPPATDSGWYKSAPNRPTTQGDHYLWTSTGLYDNSAGVVDAWTAPVRISGDKGSNGEDANDREWIYSFGNIGYDGNVGQVSPGGTASGSDTNKNQDDWVPNGWRDNPAGVSGTNKTEYASWRDITVVGNSKTYGAFHAPLVWSHYGERGMDGDGVEYVYIRTKTNVAPTIVNSADSRKDSNNRTYLDDEYLPLASGGSLSGNVECTDDPQGVDATYAFEWVIKRTKGAPIASGEQQGKRNWEKYSGTMSLWAHYSEGKGDPGYTGPMPRGLNEWKPNTDYYQGAPGEEYRDYVLYNWAKYRCAISHTSGSTFNPSLWTEANEMDFVAMKALVADDIIALAAKIDRLGVKKLETELDSSGKTTVSGGNISVADGSGNPRINIHGSVMTDAGSGTSITRPLSSVSGTSDTDNMQVTLTLLDRDSNQRIEISNSNNKVTLPAFTVNVSKSSSTLNPAVGQVMISLMFVSATSSKTIYAVDDNIKTSSGAIAIPSITTNLPVGTWGLYAYIGFISDDGKAGTFTATIIPNGTTLTVAIQTADAINEFASNGFRSVWSGEGFKATGSGAKVIIGSTEYNAIGGGSLNNLVAPKKIVLCTAYPASLDADTLYFKISST